MALSGIMPIVYEKQQESLRDCIHTSAGLQGPSTCKQCHTLRDYTCLRLLNRHSGRRGN